MCKFSIFLVLLAGTCWGTSGFFATNLRNYGFDAMQMSLMRNVFSAVCLLGFCIFKRRGTLKVPVRHLALIALSGLGMYGTGAFYYAAMKEASISVGVVLMYLAPVIVMAYSVVFLREKFTYTKLACVIATLIGTGLVTGIIGGLKASVPGIILGVMSGISYSTYNICVKHEMKRGDDPVIASTYCFIFAAVVSLVFGRPIETAYQISCNVSVLLPWVISIGLVTSVIPYITYTYAMKKIPAGVASSISAVEPLVATLIGVVLYGEPMTFASYIGMVFIITSVVLLSLNND